MKFANWFLTLFAALVLGVTLATLFWLRDRTNQELDRSVSSVIESFDPPEATLGEPNDRVVNFERADTLVRAAKRFPFIRDVIVTKTISEGSGAVREAPISPYDLAAREGASWRSRLFSMRQITLEREGRVYGRLYLDLDRSAIESVGTAILATSISLGATLLLLIGRLFFQQTEIRKVGTELDQRTRELVRLERLALAGQLTANLLHDLKKPVLNIRNRAEDLSEREIGSEIKQLTDLYFQMLGDTNLEKFVRSDKMQEEYVDVNETLRASVRLVHYERENIQIVEQLADDLPPVLAQPYRLIQVFSNLVLNAYQAMQGKGTLTLQTLKRDGLIEVRITDDGPGMSPETLQTIFEPFFTTKGESGGTGLGLAISRLIVTDMKGSIEATSAPGGPTTFRVILPVS